MPNQLKTPELNRVSVWTPIPHNDLDTRVYEEYNYISKGLVRNSKLDKKPIIRYAKNYNKFSLLLISNETDTKKIEKFLDKTAKKVKKPTKNLETTEFYYGKEGLING